MSENTTTETASTDVVTIEDDQFADARVLDVLNAENGGMVSTNKSDDFASLVDMFATAQEATDLADVLNTTIHLKDIIAEAVRFSAQVDPNTGQVTQEASNGARITLVTTDGKSYSSSSKVLLSDIGRLFKTAGQPSTWPCAIPVIVKQAGTGTRKYHTLSIDKAAFAKNYAAVSK